jgi:hypothetical protein
MRENERGARAACPPVWMVKFGAHGPHVKALRREFQEDI